MPKLNFQETILPMHGRLLLSKNFFINNPKRYQWQQYMELHFQIQLPMEDSPPPPPGSTITILKYGYLLYHIKVWHQFRRLGNLVSIVTQNLGIEFLSFLELAVACTHQHPSTSIGQFSVNFLIPLKLLGGFR